MGDSAAYPGSMLGDDIHIPDYVVLSTNTAAGSSAAEDLTLYGASGTGPSTPLNYTTLIDFLVLTNTTSSAILATVQITNGTNTYVLFTYNLAASASQYFDAANFKLTAPAGYKFQVLSSASASLAAYGTARLVPGGGY